MSELTSKTMASATLTPVDTAILTGLVSAFTGSKNPNIEDYLSELVDLLAISQRRKQRNATDQTARINGSDYSVSDLKSAVDRIKKSVVEAIGCPSVIDVHRSFVRAVHRSIRPGKWEPDQSVDYLILNYDTLIEDALALERMAYSDGLDGGATGWWNPATFDRPDLMARVIKLHGSINWCEFSGETLPRRMGPAVSGAAAGAESVLIWPASTKYRETQRDPYAQLADRARRVLKPSANKDLVLVICGYSFGDTHVNIELDRALRDSAGQLAFIVFTPDTRPQEQLKIWNDDVAVRDQVLIYAKGGFFHGVNHAVASGDLPWWKFENVVRLLGGER